MTERHTKLERERERVIEGRREQEREGESERGEVARGGVRPRLGQSARGHLERERESEI